MRFKTVILVMAVGAVILLLMFRLKSRSTGELANQSATAVSTGSTGAHSAAAPSVGKPENNRVSGGELESNGSSAKQSLVTNGTAQQTLSDGTSVLDAMAIRRRISQLVRLGCEDDAKSYESIVSDLTNSTKAIRAAARDAAVQFGNQDAVQRLKDAANFVGDPREKAEYLDAADFLALPTLFDVQGMRAARVKGAAAQPNPPAGKPRGSP